MIRRPTYFDQIRQRAVKRWDQLEQDPELAGPWHQLFKQVQSPRHVLSELLQNADDAGATEASVRVEDQVFIFEHNGEDFSEEHFSSLCRFGYSNKRALHTIGFRGIGFKSTFSLGDQVELSTPSLSVFFRRHRFTEPHWLTPVAATEEKTRIRVAIEDPHRQKEVEKNLEEWVKSPVSLLFFKNIRRVQIGERNVHWGSLGPGPVPESEWMALYEKEDESYLLLRSEAEAFPEDALAEIRQERMLGADEDREFPPCKVEIVLGAKGRLYVVLPTGVETELPFACNAPFIQDPVRVNIKSPATSPTNRWLLERTGRLAASAMLHWLDRADASLIDRASAYDLLPDVERENTSLRGVCGTTVELAFANSIEGKSYVLTEEGNVVGEDQSIVIPTPLLDIWPSKVAAALLDEKGRPPVCQHVGESGRNKLLNWNAVEEIDKNQFFALLKAKHLPRPKKWSQLLILWAYIAPEVTGYLRYMYEGIRIVPVQGKDVLYSASEVARLGEKRLLQSEDDWQFLSKYLLVLNQNWTRFLTEQRRDLGPEALPRDREAVEAAYTVLKAIGLEGTSDVGKVIDRVAAQFFAEKNVGLASCVQLAQIAAKLGAEISSAFQYVCRDGYRRPIESGILIDVDGAIEDLLPEAQRGPLLLHSDYLTVPKSCSREEWDRWVRSGFSGLLTFIPFVEMRTREYGRKNIEAVALARGASNVFGYSYVTNQFVVEDWDFDEPYWKHWKALAASDEDLWSRIAEGILAQRDTYWNKAKAARIVQVATTGSTRSITNSPLLASWILRLREQRCLPDTREIARKPDELLRRTQETEPLMDVELFVHGRLDREATRPLLDLLGVRSTPTGPDRLLECLRALAKAGKPPAHEVEKWYRRLDQMLDTCSTGDSQKIKDAFRTEKLILTADGSWAVVAAVFLSSDEDDVPGAAVIRASVSDLTLWRKLGIAERPTADLAIEWLKALPSGVALSTEDARRVRSLLVRHPLRIWEECGHWMNLAGEWASIEDFVYALTMQTLIPWSHLHTWVKQETADFQRLSGEITNSPPFSALPPLSTRVEERFQQRPVSAVPEQKEWLQTFGCELYRAELETKEQTERMRLLAASLANTSWIEAPGLEILPYIDGTPAGTPRRTEVIWLDSNIYVEKLPTAKLARLVPGEIGRAFGREDVKAALDYSYERSAKEVREYLAENFKLTSTVLGTPSTVDLESRPDEPDNQETVGDVPEAGDESKLWPDQARTQVGPDEPGVRPEEEPIPVNHDVIDVRPRIPPKPSKPTIIERFANAQGFKKEGEERFFNEKDGSWIGKANGMRFPWQRCTATGDLVCYYWPKDHCLELDPLQIEADVWGLIEQQPEIYALVLASANGDPVEISGSRLRAMREDGEVVLYPASYRLVYDQERHA